MSRKPTLRTERSLMRDGAQWVAGVDEVGVGPLAGPLAAAAVAIDARRPPRWFGDLRDSKQLLPEARERLDALIRARLPHAIGWASHEEIDRFGLTAARRLAMLRALEALPVEVDATITDALPLPVHMNRAIIRADATCSSVAAASIVAKVARDALMVRLCAEYPGYAFCHHKGYSTGQHQSLLAKQGPAPIHRKRFAPVAAVSPPW